MSKILYTLHLPYHLSSWLFFHSKFFLICFSQLFFVKSSINFFSVMILYNICPRNSIFYFFHYKKFFRSNWSVTFCKNIFIYWYSNNITNFKFRIFIINFVTRVNICVFYVILHQLVLFQLCYYMYYFIYQIYHLIYQFTNFLKLKSFIYKFYFLIFPLFCVELNLLFNCISAISATQILSIKGECTVPFSNFLIFLIILLLIIY